MVLASPARPAKNAPRDRWDDKDLIPVEIPRDQWDRPLIIPPGGGEPRAYVRASSLGNVLEYSGGISDWEKRHLLVNVAKRPDLVLSGQSIEDPDDPSAKKDIKEWVRIALEPTKAKARIGTALHRLTEQVDATGHVPDVGQHAPALRAYCEVMSAWFEILHVEAFLVNDTLGAAGTTDRIVRLKVWMQPCDAKGNAVGPPLPPGTILVLDLKTSETSRYFGAKFCTQLKVYHGGVLYDLRTGERTPIEGLHPRWALILHMPAGGNLAELYWVDLTVGETAAELAVRVREMDKAGKKAIARAAIEPWTDQQVIDTAGTVDIDPDIARAAMSGELGPREERNAAGETLGESYDRGQREADAADRLGWANADMGVPLAPAELITPALGPRLQAAHAHRRLLDQIGAATSDQAMRELWAANTRTWTEEHTAAVTARLAELAQEVRA